MFDRTHPQKTLIQLKGDPDLDHVFTAINVGYATSGGSVLIHGARVGDTVAGVFSITAESDRTSDFEATVSVADHVEQDSSSADMSDEKLLFIIKR